MSIRFLTARATPAALLPWLGGVAGLVMLVMLAWLGADIFWTLSAPESASPSALMETDLQRAQQTIVNRHLFGQYVAVVAAAAPSNLRLNGVIAAQKPGQRAYALITVEGKATQLVREGEEVAPGITLQRVQARQVELTRGGQSQTLSLPERAKSAVDAGKAPAMNTSPNPVAEALKAPAESGNPLIVNPPPVPDSPKAVIEPPPAPVAIPPKALPESGPPLPKRGRTRRSSEDE